MFKEKEEWLLAARSLELVTFATQHWYPGWLASNGGKRTTSVSLSCEPTSPVQSLLSYAHTGLPSGARLDLGPLKLETGNQLLADLGRHVVGWLLAFSESRGTQGMPANA